MHTRSLETSLLEPLNIGILKQHTAETFFWCCFLHCWVYLFEITGLCISSTHLFYQFSFKELREVGEGLGRTAGKKMSRNRKQKRCFYMLHPSAIILEQEGLLVTSNDRPRSGTCYLLAGLCCSLGKKGGER